MTLKDGAHFKLHYALFDKPIWLNSTPEQKSVLMAILSLVNFAENTWEWNHKTFVVKPGQAATSLESIAKRAGKGVSVQNVRTSLKRFEKLGFLTNESTNSGRLITVINWDTYQGKKEKLTKRLTCDQQSPNKHLTTKEEGNKERRQDKKNSKGNFPLPGWVDPEAWGDFVEHRRAIKKPLTEKAMELAIGKLEDLEKQGQPHTVSIEHAILNGWQSFYLRDKGGQRQRPQQTQDEYYRGYKRL